MHLRTHWRRDDFISKEIKLTGAWEPFETKVVQSMLEPGQVFYDIGANLGWYTVVAGLCVGPGGRVLSFEPDRENFDLLRTNIRENGLRNVSAFREAVSDHDGYGLLHLSETNRGDHQFDAPAPDRCAVRVATRSLDSIMRSEPAPDMLKLDTQGSEARILSRLTSQAARPGLSIISEFWPHGLERTGTSADALVQRLSELSAQIFLIDEARRQLRPISLSDLEWRARNDLAPHTGYFTNLLCCRTPNLPAALEAHVGPAWAVSDRLC